MFEHVRKWFPWHERARRKKEFLDKLKGTSSFEVSKNAPTGAIFMLTNQSTGGVDSYICVADNRWTVYGTGSGGGGYNLGNTFTARQLEIHLTRLVQESDANSIRIIDQGWVKPS